MPSVVFALLPHNIRHTTILLQCFLVAFPRTNDNRTRLSASILAAHGSPGRTIGHSWETYRLSNLAPSHHLQPDQQLKTMSDSPPHRIIPNYHSLSSPIPLRSALKHGDSCRARTSPPASPPLPASPAPALRHPSLSLPSASPSPLQSNGGYTPKVSFDTFENPAASMFSFTLSAESVGYARTPQTRVFLCAASQDESGRQALDWALDSLVQDGDELVVFRGFDEDDLGASACNRLDASTAIIRECADV